jgi:hypothetical protein
MPDDAPSAWMPGEFARLVDRVAKHLMHLTIACVREVAIEVSRLLI